jgi:hypothetical protein
MKAFKLMILASVLAVASGCAVNVVTVNVADSNLVSNDEAQSYSESNIK